MHAQATDGLPCAIKVDSTTLTATLIITVRIVSAFDTRNGTCVLPFILCTVSCLILDDYDGDKL